jgi:hypothetical protein
MNRNNFRINILEEAFSSFIDIVSTYASQHNLPEEDKRQLLKMITDAYVDKKLEYFLGDRLNKLGSFLNFSLDYALKNDNKSNGSNYRIGYVKHLKQLIANE